MLKSQKFRGVRQRRWGSWVSEIRHPLLKRRVWLGTFESAESAARAYDEAAILMNGRNAKTNFPPITNQTAGNESKSISSSPNSLSKILSPKLRKCCKFPSPSLTCLRLDVENSRIGVWQKSAGPRSDSNWLMMVELAGRKDEGNLLPELINRETMQEKDYGWLDGGGGSDEDRIALQMIEELLIGIEPN